MWENEAPPLGAVNKYSLPAIIKKVNQVDFERILDETCEVATRRSPIADCQFHLWWGAHHASKSGLWKKEFPQ